MLVSESHFYIYPVNISTIPYGPHSKTPLNDILLIHPLKFGKLIKMDNLKRLDQRVKIDENGFPLQRENSFHIITTVVNFVPPTSNYHSSISLDRTIAG